MATTEIISTGMASAAFIVAWLARLELMKMPVLATLKRSKHRARAFGADREMSRRDNMKIARRFNAGTGSEFDLSPEGTAGIHAHVQPSLRDFTHFVREPGVETPGYCQTSRWDEDGTGARALARFNVVCSSALDKSKRAAGRTVKLAEARVPIKAARTKHFSLRECGWGAN